jgi:hypothetical protein
MGSPHDLARLPELKTWLGISSEDEDLLLETLISRTSRAILAYLGRPSIIPSVYTDVYENNNYSYLLLRQWPVISIISCVVDGVSLPRGGGSLANSTDGYVVELDEGSPPGRMQKLFFRANGTLKNSHITTVSYYAGYQISGEKAVVPPIAPFETVILAPFGAFANDVGVIDSLGSSFVKVGGIPGPGQYSQLNGTYRFSEEDAGSQLQISYGYVPSDLERCCVEWASEQYLYRTRIGQRAKSLGSQESVSFIVKEMPDLVRLLLQPYRRVISP